MELNIWIWICFCWKSRGASNQWSRHKGIWSGGHALQDAYAHKGRSDVGGRSFVEWSIRWYKRGISYHKLCGDRLQYLIRELEGVR